MHYHNRGILASKLQVQSFIPWHSFPYLASRLWADCWLGWVTIISQLLWLRLCFLYELYTHQFTLLVATCADHKLVWPFTLGLHVHNSYQFPSHTVKTTRQEVEYPGTPLVAANSLWDTPSTHYNIVWFVEGRSTSSCIRRSDYSTSELRIGDTKHRAAPSPEAAVHTVLFTRLVTLSRIFGQIATGQSQPITAKRGRVSTTTLYTSTQGCKKIGVPTQSPR